jgi:hypothetical protein
VYPGYNRWAVFTPPGVQSQEIICKLISDFPETSILQRHAFSAGSEEEVFSCSVPTTKRFTHYPWIICECLMKGFLKMCGRCEGMFCPRTSADEFEFRT